MRECITVPGRVNLIGEHIDYHGLPVLPMALRRSIRVAFRPRADRTIRAATSLPYGGREFEWTGALEPVGRGDWENYLRAAANVARTFLRDADPTGIDAEVTSDLPPAAGLSSSTALLVAFTLALLHANGRTPAFAELMEVLPDGEQFVGTRGGGMDHAAVLGSHAGAASLIEFYPVSLRPVPVPPGWAFLVAHSMQSAEKAGGARAAYNARRAAGTEALATLGFDSYRAALAGRGLDELTALAKRLGTLEEHDAFLHTVTEAVRVREAVAAMERADDATFATLLLESHMSLRDRLHVSSPGLERLVDAALDSGASGARLTGAGFGGCAVIFCSREDVSEVRRNLIQRFYTSEPDFREDQHLIDADAAPGVLTAAQG